MALPPPLAVRLRMEVPGPMAVLRMGLPWLVPLPRRLAGLLRMVPWVPLLALLGVP